MKIVQDNVSLKELKKLAKKRFGDMVKAVVDVEREIMAIDGELHADEEALLLEKESQQNNLWGINLYPDIKGDDWIEFDSMINLRPSQNNLSRSVEDKKLKIEIVKVVNKLVTR